VVIAGEMSVLTAGDWRARLLAAMGAPGDVELDLSGVSDIDAVAIQALVYLRIEADAWGRAVRLVARSAKIREALEFCNLTRFFDDAQSPPCSAT
jgi:anti-anti-sigma factor